jgi:hypothetical protein
VCACASAARAQSPVADDAWRVSLANVTRVESWHFFDPPPTGGDPSYQFLANRLRVSLAGRWPRADFDTAVQFVQFAGLPATAVGPGALGTGALYYMHSGQSDARSVYLRTLALRLRPGGGVTLQAGRFGYTSGAEAPSGSPTVEAIKRSRLDSRLIGEFEWSIFQRSFDGVRVDVDRKRWHATGGWMVPTQGGFEDDAGRRRRGVNVAAVTLSAKPDTVLRSTEVALFGYRYRDTRDVTSRPDNTGRSTLRADITVITFGASAVRARPTARGESELLAWFAGQAGDWYGQPHRAWSLALEAGHEWKARARPRVRGGYLHASGDQNPTDHRHGTFFANVPTVRKYSLTTVYAPMNLRDVFAECVLRPHSRLIVRGDLRQLWLAEANDRWYGGSGATASTGGFFGYAGRPSGGSTGLGTVAEGSADMRLGRYWSVNGFVGVIHGGNVVASSFVNRWLRFAYLESVVQF